MIELLGAGGRVPPIQLNHLQAVLAVAALLGLGLGVAGLILLEGLLDRILGFLLRATGHPPPRKSPMRVALDAMEEEMKKGKQSR